MKKVVTVFKKVGETPLMALQAFVKKYKTYQGMPATYAGRLDPMASGKLLLLFGEECKKKEAYLSVDKEYEVEILLDAESDTGDALGVVQYQDRESSPTKKEIQSALEAELGSHERTYPLFSSKPVNGKPLFLHSLEDTISSITIPTHTETVYAIRLRSIKKIHARALRARIFSYLAKVPKTDDSAKMRGADFRIKEVLASWQHLFERIETHKRRKHFTSILIRVRCASGTYMRSLAPRIGASLHTTALALSIKRTKILPVNINSKSALPLLLK